LNPKLLKRMDRNPRVTEKEMIFVPLGMSNNALKSGCRVVTTSLCDKAGTIEVRQAHNYIDTESNSKRYRVFLNDLCKP